jgi:hypothetical protein
MEFPKPGAAESLTNKSLAVPEGTTTSTLLRSREKTVLPGIR